MDVLAARLKWLRDQKRLSQKEVASEIGITLNGYQQMEYDKTNPKIDTLIKLAQYLEVTTDFLLGLSDKLDMFDKLKWDLTKYRQEIEFREDMRSERMKKLYDLESEYREIMNVNMENENNLHKDKLNRIQKEIDITQKELTYHDHNIHHNRILQERALFEYIQKIYDIPYSRPENDEIIKPYLPLDVTLEVSGDENRAGYKVRLKSLNGTALGLLYMSQGDNNEQNYMDAIIHWEESKQFFRISDEINNEPTF